MVTSYQRLQPIDPRDVFTVTPDSIRRGPNLHDETFGWTGAIHLCGQDGRSLKDVDLRQHVAGGVA